MATLAGVFILSYCSPLVSPNWAFLIRI